MIHHAIIIPTGNEIKTGVVVDTNSPMIRATILRLNPDCRVQIACAVTDEETLIVQAVQSHLKNGADFICLIGGSGGGHRHSSTLSRDYTHTALDLLLPNACNGALYGKNGHLWSKLYCGMSEQSLIINVPGPYREAKAAIEAFCESYWKAPEDLKTHVMHMLAAVKQQYG